VAKPTAKFRIEGEDATALAFKSAMGNAQKTAKGIEGAFKAAFAGISVALVTRAIGGAVGSALAFGDEIDRAATKAGIGGRAMSELAHAAHIADVELAGLSTGIKFMQKNLGEAARGGKEQIEVLNLLGLQYRNLKGLAADKQFEIIADRIYELKDPLDKTRAATELFGRSGEQLLPLFEKGAEGIRAARIEAVELGKSLSDDQVKALADAEKEVKKLSAAWVGFKNIMVAEVAPELSEALTAATAKMTGGAALIRHELQIATETLARAQAAGADEDSLSRIEAKIREHRAALGLDSATGGRGGGPNRLAPIVVTGQRLATDKTRAAAARAQEELDKEALKRREDALNRENDLNEYFADLSRDVQEQIGKEAQDVLDETVEATKEAADIRYEIELDLQKKMEDAAVEHAAEIEGILAAGIFDAFDDGLKGMLKGFINVLKQMAAEAAAADIMRALGGTSTNPGLGDLFGSMFGGMREKGGPIEQGKWYIAGERGPEPIWGGGPGAMAMGYGKGGVGHIEVNIDARGSSVESVKLLQIAGPLIARQAADMAVQRIRDLGSRGGL
jgi:hypothetical protein